MAPVLAYWAIRGLAQPIRLLLGYVGEDFNAKNYTSMDQWTADKFKLGLDFPNLPYYIDDNVKLTQSGAILRYIARKHGLAGKPEDEQIMNMVDNHLGDIRMRQAMLGRSADLDAGVLTFLKELPNFFKMVSKFLGEKQWLCNEITYLDFILYEVSFITTKLDSKSLDDFANLKAHMTRFENLDKIKAYVNSPKYVEYPITVKA